jgi:hypothetical protein
MCLEHVSKMPSFPRLPAGASGAGRRVGRRHCRSGNWSHWTEKGLEGRGEPEGLWLFSVLYHAGHLRASTKFRTTRFPTAGNG